MARGPFLVVAPYGHCQELPQTPEVTTGNELGLTPIQELAVENGSRHSGKKLLGSWDHTEPAGNLVLPRNGLREDWVSVTRPHMVDSQIPGRVDSRASSGVLPCVTGGPELDKSLLFAVVQHHDVSAEHMLVTPQSPMHGLGREFACGPNRRLEDILGIGTSGNETMIPGHWLGHRTMRADITGP